MRVVLKIASVSILITCLISTLFGLAGQSIIGTFWSWFWISLLCQFILFAVVNSFLIQKDDIALKQTELEALDKLAKFTIKISCAYCQQPNTTPIQLNQRNTFKCDSCNQVNGIAMQFTSTTLTTPVEGVVIPVPGNEPSIEFKVS